MFLTVALAKVIPAAAEAALRTMIYALRFALVTAVASFANLASAQDLEYVRAVERAQQLRPSALAAAARIAPLGEPGTPMTLHGRVVRPDGNPASDTIVFAYHTDRDGLYDRPAAGEHSWRLKGWVKADRDGRFTFETIRPGPYPGRRVPAHVHFTVFLPNGERFHAGEAKFDDDPLLSQGDRADAKRADDFGEVHPVRREGNVEHVQLTLRIDPAQRF